MSELAFNIQGEAFEPPPAAVGWRVRRMKKQGAPEVVYGRDGLPLVVPIEAGMEDLKAAAAIPTSVRDMREIRNQAAIALLACDVLPPRRVALNLTPACMASHPNIQGKPLIAVGQAKAFAWVGLSVDLVDPQAGKVVRSLLVLPHLCWNHGRLVQDGIRALAFDPQGGWLVAGTRTGRLCRWDLERLHEAPIIWQAGGEAGWNGYLLLEGVVFRPGGALARCHGRHSIASLRWPRPSSA